MRAAVKEAWHRFSEPLEGRCYHMYLDLKGLVTTAVGILIDSVGAAQSLPWKRPSGELASPSEVAAAWALVKSRQQFRLLGGNHRVFHELTALRLSEADVDAIVWRKLDNNEMLLTRFFPEMGDWPADAQLAIHSWAWAVGVYSPYPKMFAALRDKDFAGAAEQIGVDTDGPDGVPDTSDDIKGTLVERNRRNKLLMQNAERVRNFHFDPERLYWPGDLKELVQAAETVPEVENPVSEDDGGAARHKATLDAVEHRFDGESEEDKSPPKTKWRLRSARRSSTFVTARVSIRSPSCSTSVSCAVSCRRTATISSSQTSRSGTVASARVSRSRRIRSFRSR